MDYKEWIDKDNQIRAQMSVFDSWSGCKEYHIILKGINPVLSFAEQLTGLASTYKSLITGELKEATPVFKRYFLSDIANQAELLPEMQSGKQECAVSVTGQPLLNGAKVALWVILQTDVEVYPCDTGLGEVIHNSYRHLWGSAVCQSVSGSYEQTLSLFEKYISQLNDYGYTLADNCQRTWLLIDNIDVNYAGMVESRNKIFAGQGLTKETHSIASTGIYGRNQSAQNVVRLDTYAVGGICPEQIQYLYAPGYLNPTHEYGVSFERGTSIQYGDRKQVFISGTASINNQGEIVWPGDIHKQTLRMWENVEALLKEADCTFNDLSQLIVYLRDPADFPVVNNLFKERFPHIPKVIVWAPVCREGWLIEMECIALKAIPDTRFRDY